MLNNDYLGISPEDICIRINSSDFDLVESISFLKKDIKIEYNSEPIECYKHIYGMNEEQITGRNFNIAIRKNGTDNYFDCAAIIVMENPNKKIGIDMGIGNTSLSMCHFNENNTVAASRISDIIKIDTNAKMRLADSITAVATLLSEDVQNSESRHFRKKLKRYIHIMNYWKEYFCLSQQQLEKYIYDYLMLEYNLEIDLTENNIRKVLTYKRGE